MTAGKSDGPITSINVTPLVDILLVLLIIFMTTAPLIRNRIVKIAVPNAARSQVLDAQALVVTYDAQKRLSLSGRPINPSELVRALAAAVRADPSVRITLAADKSLSYEDVMTILDAVRKSGARSVGLEVSRR